MWRQAIIRSCPMRFQVANCRKTGAKIICCPDVGDANGPRGGHPRTGRLDLPGRSERQAVERVQHGLSQSIRHGLSMPMVNCSPMTQTWNGISVRLGIEPRECVMPTSGSEFGWRSGTGNWPPLTFEDSLPPAVEIGPGSPTGVFVRYGHQVPRPLSEGNVHSRLGPYSTIYTIDLEPNGSTYTGKKIGLHYRVRQCQ